MSDENEKTGDPYITDPNALKSPPDDVEKSLLESDQRFRSVFENVADGLVLVDAQTLKIIDCNNVICQNMGYTKKEFCNLKISDLEVHETPEEIRDHVKKIQKDHNDVFETQQRTKEGQIRDILVKSKDISWNGKPYILSVWSDITERKQVQKALQESEARYRELFDHMGNGVAVYEAVNNASDFIFRDINQAGQRLSQVQKDHIIGKSLTKVFPGAKELGLWNALQEVWRTGRPQHVPLKLYQDNRISQWVENYVFKLPSGELIAVYDDITKRKQVENQLSQSEAFLNAVIDQSPIAMWIADSSGTLIRLNQACCNLLNVTEEEVVGKYNVFQDNIVASQGYLSQVKKVFDNGKAVTFAIEYDSSILKTVKLKNTVSLILDVSMFPIKDDRNRVTHVVVQHRDVTKEKQAEYQINMLAKFPEENPNPVIRLAKDDAMVLYANKAGAQLLEFWNCKEGKTLPSPWADQVLQAARTGQLIRSEVACDHSFYALSIVPLKELSYVNIYGLDITDRKLAEQSLQQSEAKYRNLFENSIEGIGIAGENCVVSANQAMLDIFGYTFEEFVRIPILDHVAPESRPLVKQYMEQRKKQGPLKFQYDYKIIRKDGQIRDLSLSSSPIMIDGKYYTQTVVRDITDRKQAEAKLKNSQTLLNEMGHITHTGGWEHDLVTGQATWTDELYQIIRIENQSPPGPNEHLNYYPQEDRKILQAAYQKAVEKGEPFDLELHCKRADGEVFWCRITGEPVYDRGRCVKMRGAFQDITPRKLAEQDLKRSESLLNQTQKIARVGGWEYNVENKNTVWTDEVYHIHDIPKNPDLDLISSSFACFDPRDRHLVEKAFNQCVKSGKPYDLELRLISAAGQKLWVRTSGHPVYKEDKIVAVVGDIMDITERKQTQQELRNLARHIETLQEQERVNIAREVHDELGQILAVLKMDMGRLVKDLTRAHPKTLQKCQTMTDHVDLALDTVHRICTQLRPEMLDDFGLEASLKNELNEFKKHWGVKTKLIWKLAERDLTPQIAIDIYRICREAMTNVAQHAKASNLWIEIANKDSTLRVTIDDDGCGVKPEQTASSTAYGLIGMRERSLALGGDFTIENRNKGGTRIQITIPLQNHMITDNDGL